MNKLYSRRAALTIQELAEGQSLKSCNVISPGFENDGLRKKVITFYLNGKLQFQLKLSRAGKFLTNTNYANVAALSMMVSMFVGL